jgi:hypothetical protein
MKQAKVLNKSEEEPNMGILGSPRMMDRHALAG